MYYSAQIKLHYSLFLNLVSLAFAIREGSVTTTVINQSAKCPLECICLSPTHIICNTGSLKDIPSSLPETVEELSLTKNDFSVIRSEAFTGLRYLRKLSLDGNNISFIKPFAFLGLHRLTYLSIEHTPLPFIGSFSFAALQNVSLILLANNQIQFIQGKAFAGTSSIKVIRLTNNPLHVIHTNAFSGLTNVDHLIFPSGIQTIEQDAFNGLEFVGMFKLTFMDLKGLRPNTFRGLKHVHSLNIQESDLGEIHKDAFAGIEYVDNLNIMKNKIDAILRLHLKSNYSIKTFRFQGNHVLRAPKYGGTFFQVKNISVIKNQFPCDCQIHLILESDFVSGSKKDFRNSNLCLSPLEYYGKSMNVVDPDQFARCSDRLTKDNLGSGVNPELGIRSFSIIFCTIYLLILF